MKHIFQMLQHLYKWVRIGIRSFASRLFNPNAFHIISNAMGQFQHLSPLCQSSFLVDNIWVKKKVCYHWCQVFHEVCGDDCTINLDISSDKDRELLEQSRIISQKMTDIENSISSVESSIFALHTSLPGYIRYEIKFDRQCWVNSKNFFFILPITCPIS